MAGSPWAKPFNRSAKVPLVGPWLGRIGRTINIVSSGACSPTPSIWIQAGFNAIPTMIWTFIKPSPTDFLGERVGRKKHKIKFNYRGFDPFPITPKGEIGWIGVTGVGLLRRIGWYFTVADVTSGGLLNWVSTAYRWNGCVPDGAHYANLHMVPGTVELLPAGDYVIDTWNVDNAVGLGAGPTGIAGPPNDTVSVGFSLSSQHNSFGLPDASWSASLQNTQTGEYVTSQDSVNTGPGETHTSQFWANGLSVFRKANKANAGGNYRVILHKSFGVVEFAGGTMHGTSSPLSNAITPDP